jgi:hypothetical protein
MDNWMCPLFLVGQEYVLIGNLRALPIFFGLE